MVSVPGGVPSLLSVVEVGGGIRGGVQPWLRGWSVYSVIGEVPGHLKIKNVFFFHVAFYGTGLQTRI